MEAKCFRFVALDSPAASVAHFHCRFRQYSTHQLMIPCFAECHQHQHWGVAKRRAIRPPRNTFNLPSKGVLPPPKEPTNVHHRRHSLWPPGPSSRADASPFGEDARQ